MRDSSLLNFCYINGISVILSFAQPYGYRSICSGSPKGVRDAGIFAQTVSNSGSKPHGIRVSSALSTTGGCDELNGTSESGRFSTLKRGDAKPYCHSEVGRYS